MQLKGKSGDALIIKALSNSSDSGFDMNFQQETNISEFNEYEVNVHDILRKIIEKGGKK